MFMSDSAVMEKTQTIRSQPELLAPAGDWEALRAAVANGADAVYFGLSNFNARHRATNFSLAELPEVMRYLHDRNVLGYIAFNTLIFSDELAEAAKSLEAIALAGADAVIVQDLGLARLIHLLAPDLPIHGSTQMTLTEHRGIEFVRRLGVSRAILARELSLDDIRRIAARTIMPLEVFVHGALCVAYSGQCLTSEALGGRSANRGQCAQACRLPYELIVDGVKRDLGDQAYLLSPQDLAAYDLIDPLLEIGVVSFKIEGRLKSPQYVAVASQTYRAAIDAAVAKSPYEITRHAKLDLSQTFSRGFTHGFLSGVNHQQLAPALFPKSRGVRIGTVVEKISQGVVVEIAAEHIGDDAIGLLLKPGDGLAFDEGHPEKDEQGGRIYGVRPRSERRAELTFGQGQIDNALLTLGCTVWKTDDPALRKRTEQSYNRDLTAKRRPIDFRLRGQFGGPLELLASHQTAAAPLVGTATWAGPIEPARRHSLTRELAREQLDRLGDTPFELGEVQLELPEGAMVPKSVLNELRRAAVAQLQSLCDAGRPKTIHPTALDQLRGEVALHNTRLPTPDSRLPAAAPALHVLVRNLDQLAAVLTWQPPAPLARPATVYCDFEDVRRYRQAVIQCHDAGQSVGLATMRILKPGEEGLLSQVAHVGADSVLIRNLAGLAYFQDRSPNTPRIGDFSLNIANELTADLFFGEGLARLTPSYDLNWDQLVGMLKRSAADRFEVVVHQHIPMFHMEHCVFAATLSTGKDWRDCGRPCDRHKVTLRDRVGAEFPLSADTGCRNTVYNSVAQSAAEYVSRMLALGVRHFRVELLHESAAEATKLLETYSRVISGQESGRNSWRQLQVLNQLGVTRGTLQKA